MPVYVDITVQVATGYQDKTQQEWVDYIDSMDKFAATLDYNIPTPNKDIAVFSPGQVNVGENIYEYIVPNSFLTLSSAENSAPVDRVDEAHAAPLPRRNNSYAVPLLHRPGENQYVKLVPKPRKPIPVPTAKRIAKAPPTKPKRPLPSPTTPISPPPVYPKHVGKQSSSLERQTSQTNSKDNRATVSPFQYTPSRYKSSLDNPSANSLDPVNQLEKSQRVPLLQISEIPSDVSRLTVEEVCDCLKLLNLGDFVEAARKLQIDGFLLKEFCAEDYQKDPNFKMSTTQSKKLVRFAQDGWRPRHS